MSVAETEAGSPMIEGRRDFTITRVFSRAATSVGRVRAWVRDRLRAARVDDEVVWTAELLVSEIAGNAVQHGRGDRMLVRLTLDGEHGELSASVHDRDAAGQPTARGAHDDDAERGRGLALVHSLASAWGTDIVRSGKWVWFRLPLRLLT